MHVTLLVVCLLALLAPHQSIRFLISREQDICIYENLPKNEELVTQIIVDKSAKNFNITITHLNDKMKVIERGSTLLYNHRDIFIHQEGRIEELTQTRLSMCASSRILPKGLLWS